MGGGHARQTRVNERRGAAVGARTGRWRLLAFAAVAAQAACAGGGDAVKGGGGAAAVASAARTAPDPLAAVASAIAPDGPYRVVPVSNPGALAGRITVDSVPALHDTTLSGDDSSACGPRIPDRSVVAAGHGLADALVWVADAREGRALPRVRRTDLAIVRCQFVPRVLALVAGTTINLQSQDATVHHTRFYSESADSLLSRLFTVDRWAVVPSATIAADPGFVRVRLTRRPFVRGYVAVFAHPYFGVTNRSGRYRISGLPAGTYRVRVWHEREGDPIDRVVTVRAGRQATFDTTLVLH